MTHPLWQLTAILGLGIGAQWLSWRLKLPSIFLLLVVGFVAGPVTQFIDPDALLGDLLFPVVGLSVSLILFEGGLSLDVSELKEIGRVVRNLISIGALVTWVGAGALAYFLLDFDLALSALLGAILVVTGPTVIGPLLRHVRPRAVVGSTVKWEGIVNDPIGAILAVLVFDVIVAGGFEGAANAAALGILRALVAGGLLGIAGAAVVVILLKRYWVPDYLQSPVTLGIVVTVFATANTLMDESGLLAVTIMGSALASQNKVTVRHIVEFKENLRVLLLSTLFIVLAARLPLRDPTYTDPASFLFLAGLVFLVRPAAVAISSVGSSLGWRERTFLAFMAPRGIVAAAVSSIFALELLEAGYPEAARLAPVTFLVIVGTVGLYGLTAGPAARLLGVATPDPQGMLFVGASPWVREVAQLLRDQDIQVVLLDANWSNVTAARRAGLTAYYKNVLDEHAIDDVDLDGVGRLLALTSNDEVNALAALHVSEVMGRSNVYQLPPENSQGAQRRLLPRHLQGRYLFSPDATCQAIARRYQMGATVKRTTLTPEFDYEAYQNAYGGEAMPLFVIRESGQVAVVEADTAPAPKAGQTLISLVPSNGHRGARATADTTADERQGA